MYPPTATLQCMHDGKVNGSEMDDFFHSIIASKSKKFIFPERYGYDEVLENNILCQFANACYLVLLLNA